MRHERPPTRVALEPLKLRAIHSAHEHPVAERLTATFGLPKHPRVPVVWPVLVLQNQLAHVPSSVRSQSGTGLLLNAGNQRP